MTGPRRRFLRTGGTALFAAMLLVLAGLPSAAHAAERYRETIAVSVDGGSGTTQATLLPDVPYTLAVEGTYDFASGSADAECSRSIDPVWQRDRQGYDLFVDGLDVDWQPVVPDVLGCNSQDHRYTLTLSVQSQRRLVFSIDVPAGQGGSGVLAVVLEGPAVAEPPASEPAGSSTVAPAPANQEPVPAEQEKASADEEPAPAPPPVEEKPAPAASRPSDDAEPAPTRAEADSDNDTGRVLTTDELLEMFAPEAVASGAASTTPERASIELTTSPVRPDSPSAAPASSSTLVTWLALFLLVGVAFKLLASTHSRGRLVQVLGAEARVVAELVTGNNSSRAVAHRVTEPPSVLGGAWSRSRTRRRVR